MLQRDCRLQAPRSVIGVYGERQARCWETGKSEAYLCKEVDRFALCEAKLMYTGWDSVGVH